MAVDGTNPEGAEGDLPHKETSLSPTRRPRRRESRPTSSSAVGSPTKKKPQAFKISDSEDEAVDNTDDLELLSIDEGIDKLVKAGLSKPEAKRILTERAKKEQSHAMHSKVSGAMADFPMLSSNRSRDVVSAWPKW